MLSSQRLVSRSTGSFWPVSSAQVATQRLWLSGPGASSRRSCRTSARVRRRLDTIACRREGSRPLYDAYRYSFRSGGLCLHALRRPAHSAGRRTRRATLSVPCRCAELGRAVWTRWRRAPCREAGPSPLGWAVGAGGSRDELRSVRMRPVPRHVRFLPPRGHAAQAPAELYGAPKACRTWTRGVGGLGLGLQTGSVRSSREGAPAEPRGVYGVSSEPLGLFMETRTQMLSSAAHTVHTTSTQSQNKRAVGAAC